MNSLLLKPSQLPFSLYTSFLLPFPVLFLHVSPWLQTLGCPILLIPNKHILVGELSGSLTCFRSTQRIRRKVENRLRKDV